MRGLVVILAVLGIFACAEVNAQTKRRVIQLSGFVTDTATQMLPGVHVYVPKAGRGTPTTNSGFFTLPVLVGDSVVFSSVGYKRASYIVPDLPKESWTIFVELAPDLNILDGVVVMGIPTEELFKEAVLAMNIPLDNGVDPKALNSEMIALMARTTPLDGAGNYKYYIDQWSNSAGDKFRPQYNPFLDPIKWAKFIKSLKKKK
jgi:CarboxypepD_reg-like domain